MDILLVVIAVVVIIGGAALAYFLIKKTLAKDSSANEKPVKEKPAEKPAVDKKAAAAEKRRAEMMKKIEVVADPKVLEHRLVKKAATEITAKSRDIDRIEVKTNRIDWYVKEDADQSGNGNVFFDDLALHRLEQGEMKLVAEHLYNIVKSNGFELSEEGSGEKGTFRYHIDKYVIKSL